VEKKKFHRPPANIVYDIDGASYGLDDGLVEAIKSSISARLQSQTLEIPRLPQVAGRILQLSQSPTTEVGDIVEVLSTDPLLAARVLTLTNSAAYGTTQRIEGLKPALMRLGLNAVRDLVFAESIRVRIFSARSYRSILEDSWKLSLGTAIACEAMSRATGLEREGAFLVGLLHDTGKPVLVNAVSEIEKKNQGRALGQEIVEILLSQLHEEIGGYVLERWEMPASFVRAAGEHHRYRGAAHTTDGQRLVFAGNLVCRHLGIGDVQKEVNFTVEHVFADLGLNDLARIEPMLENVKAGVEQMLVGLKDAA
jgi:HD-like signal output (HDOD) protein